MAAEAGGVVGAEGVRGAAPVVPGARLLAGCAVGEHWGQRERVGDTVTKPPLLAVGTLPRSDPQKPLSGDTGQLAAAVPKKAARDAEGRLRVWNLLPDFRQS